MSQSSCSSRFNEEARYAELINPCRDPNKNWEIKIAETLREYLNWVNLASASLQLRAGVPFNFAEAALLIQGSTCVFGKKVEYLYNLAQQLYNQLIHEKRSNAASSNEQQSEPTATKRKENIHGGRNVEFVSMDNIKKCNNVDLNESIDTDDKKIKRIPATPLALIPLDSIEKGEMLIYCANGDVLGKKKDFQMNICTMHSRGCLLLPTIDYLLTVAGNRDTQDIDMESTDHEDEEEDPMMVDDNCYTSPVHSPSPVSVNGIGSNNGTSASGSDSEHQTDNQHSEEPCVSEAGDSNDAFNGVSQENVPNGANEKLDQSVVVEKEIVDGQRRSSRRLAIQAQKKAEELKAKKEQERLRLEEEAKSAWTVTTSDSNKEVKPIEKKNVRKLPQKLRKRPISKTTEKSALDFVTDKIFSVEYKYSKKMRIGINKLTVNTAFEQMIFERLKEQQKLMQNCCKKLNLDNEIVCKEEPRDEEQTKDNADDNDLGAEVLPNEDSDDDCDILPPPDNCLDDLGVGENGDGNFVLGEGLNNSYEDCVRQHIEDFASEVREHSSANDLYQRVSKWEQRIKPLLDEQNNRKLFKIHEYGSKVLDSFGNNNRKQTLPFADICKDKPKWEVCRYFLASLQLVNNSNIEITKNLKPSGNHEVYLTLLSRKRHQEQLEEFGHSLGEHL